MGTILFWLGGFMKRFYSIIILFLFTFFLFFNEYSYANPLPVVWGALELSDLVFGTSAMAGVSAMFATQGVTFNDAKSSRNAIAEFIYKYPDAVRQSIVSWPETQLFKAKAAIKISQSVWDAGMDYVNKLEQGVNKRKNIEVSVGADGKILPYQQPYAISGVNMVSISGAYVSYNVLGNWVIDDCSLVWNDYVTERIPAVLPLHVIYAYKTLIKTVSGVSEYEFTYLVRDAENHGGGVIYAKYEFPQSVDILEETGVSDSYYDYTKSGVAIPVPQDSAGDRTIVVPLSVPYTGAVGLTGADCIPKTNVQTDATTHTDADTGSTVPNEFKYPELQVPADIIKNKFPFCVPYDLKNSITSLLVQPVAPSWKLNFDNRYFVGGKEITIDFTQFELWAKIVRWGLLIAFNVGLIIITRKIIGAGG
jgi:hypothetical protein